MPGPQQTRRLRLEEVRDHFAQYDFRGRYLAFRIGINSGPVVTGAIALAQYVSSARRATYATSIV